MLTLACGGEIGTGVEAPTLQVTVATGGTELDPDGYTLTIDGGQARPVGLNATVAMEDLSEGDHTIQLSDVAANCAVQGENPSSVVVRAGEAATVEFEVTCSATTGGLQVTTATSGTSLDPDGYTVLLDGAERGPVGASETVTIGDLAPSAHAVGLSGVATNCQIEGDNPRTVTVTAGQAAVVAFSISCTTPPASSGTLRVTTATSGRTTDPDGYEFAIDDRTTQPIGVNATVSVANLAAGPHTVRLSGVAAHCRVESENPRSVTVPVGGKVEAGFRITCAATTGSLHVTTATTGEAPDPDGYAVLVDGGLAQPIGLSGTLTIPNLAPGLHNVRLSEMSANCVLEGDNPRSVEIRAGEQATVTFNVACAALLPLTGALRVTTSTTGAEIDPDGYVLAIDDGPVRSIGVNANETVADLAAGPHTVQLTGFTSNCAVEGTNARSVTVPAGATAEVSFVITCRATTGSIQVTTRTSGADLDPDGYTWCIGSPGPGVRQCPIVIGRIAVNETVTFGRVTPGEHTFGLGDLAANCQVDGDNPQPVTVSAGETAEVSFAITCTATTGSIQVTTTTTGADLDPDGYTWCITSPGPGIVRCRVALRRLEINETVTFERLTPGEYAFHLGDLAPNCQVDGDNPQTVIVSAGGTAEVSFAITCNVKRGLHEVGGLPGAPVREGNVQYASSRASRSTG